MPENEDELVWTFKCPNCGSKAQLLQSIVDEDRAVGRLGEGVTWGALDTMQFPVTDRQKNPRPGDEASVFTAWYDICEKCGVRYCYRASRQVKKYSLDLSNLIAKPPPGPLPPLPLFGPGEGGPPAGPPFTPGRPGRGG